MSEDILERAKKALIDDDMTYKDYDECISLLIAEVKRLRSENNRINKLREAEINQAGAAERVYLEAMMVKDARIKELEADRIEARAQYLLFMNDNPGCIAWNFDELDETEQDALREQARYMLELEEPWAYIQLREAREQIKRLEAAFLEAEEQRLAFCKNFNHDPKDRWVVVDMDGERMEAEAHEALERIRNGE